MSSIPLLQVSFILFLSYAQIGQALAQFECKTELAIGYHFDKETKKFSQIQFEGGKTYVIKKLPDETKDLAEVFDNTKDPVWGVFRGSDNNWEFSCSGPEERLYQGGKIECGNFVGNPKFTIDLPTLRFRLYNDTGPNGDDSSPTMEVGRCKIIHAPDP